MEIFLTVFGLVVAMAFILAPVSWMIDHNTSGWLQAGWVATSVLILASVVGYAYDHRTVPPTFSLETAKWECTSTYEVQRYTGKHWTTDTVCSQWSRKATQ